MCLRKVHINRKRKATRRDNKPSLDNKQEEEEKNTNRNKFKSINLNKKCAVVNKRTTTFSQSTRDKKADPAANRVVVHHVVACQCAATFLHCAAVVAAVAIFADAGAVVDADVDADAAVVARSNDDDEVSSI